MKDFLIVVAILLGISIVVEVILSRIKKARNEKLMYLLMEGKYKEFDELLEKKGTKFFVPVYNSLILKVNKAIMTNNVNYLNGLMNEANKIRMNDKQKMYLYSKAFSYYLTIKEESRCTKCYRQIELCKDSPTKEYIEMVYDTFIKKGYQYIEKVEKMLVDATDADKENLQSLLSAMQENQASAANK